MKIGIIFDLDGTLLDTLEDLADSVNYIMKSNGCPEHSIRAIRDMVGNGVRNLILQALPQEKKDMVDRILPDYREYYAAHSQDKTRPYTGILAAVEALAKEYPIAVASNKPDPMVKPLCREYFGDIYALGERPECPKKPAPDMVWQVMAQLGVEKCVFVGDSEVDVVTAANAKVPCLSVLWGFRDRDVLEAAGGKYFCQDPAELYDSIKEIIRKEGL